MRRPSTALLVAGVVLIAAGFLAVGLGWWNASRIDVETGQLPYLVSGGFGGLGLLVLGAIVVGADVVRRAAWASAQSTARLAEAIESLSGELRDARARAQTDDDRDDPLTADGAQSEADADRADDGAGATSDARGRGARSRSGGASRRRRSSTGSARRT